FHVPVDRGALPPDVAPRVAPLVPAGAGPRTNSSEAGRTVVTDRGRAVHRAPPAAKFRSSRRTKLGFAARALNMATRSTLLFGRATLALCLAVGCAQPALAASSLATLIQSGDRAAALKDIAAGADVNASQGDGTTPLIWAVYKVDAELVATLLKHGAKP